MAQGRSALKKKNVTNISAKPVKKNIQYKHKLNSATKFTKKGSTCYDISMKDLKDNRSHD
jgi:hypothetical protein